MLAPSREAETSKTDTKQREHTTYQQRRCELFVEEPRGENRGERALREERDGCDCGGEMAERVGGRDLAAQLRDQAEADQSGQPTMVGNF